MSNEMAARQVPLPEPREKESSNPAVFPVTILSKRGAVVNPPDSTIRGPAESRTGLAKSEILTNHLPLDVKMMAEFKERHILDMDQVEVVRTIYPGFDGTLLSKCRNYRKYGVRIRTDALNALAEHFRVTEADAPRRPARKKANRVQCRLSNELFKLLQRRIAQTGQTAQDYLESVIIADLQAHAKELRT